MSKARHVLSQGQTRPHTCHWRAYKPGQEAGQARVTREYIDAARDVQAWITQHLAHQPRQETLL